MKDTLADNLKLLRGRETQDRWAEEFGVNKMTVSAWERGLRWPKQSHLMRIAKRKKLKVGDLFREDLFIDGTIIREPKAEYSADLTAAYTKHEIQDIVRLLWNWKKDNPTIDILQFLRGLRALPEEKQKLVLQLVDAIV